MKRLLAFGLLLLAAGLSACSGSVDIGQSPLAPTANQPASDTSTPVAIPTVTPSLLPKIVQSPGNTPETTRFSDAPDRDLFRLTRELVPGSGDISRAIIGDGEEYLVGHTETFWLVDLADTKTYQSIFELVLVTPHAYWYVEDGLDVDISDLLRSSLRYEKDIYPVVTRIFGSEWNPGIDNDSRLNILNARLSGVAGYFSSSDEYPVAVQPRSNQREVIYINALNVRPGGANYDQVLAHELQHAVHWNVDASEDTWINEGLAELSSSITLDSTFSIRQFLRGSPVSLINWPTSSVGGIRNYGAASLFMHFFTEHYGGQEGIRALLAEPEDGIKGIDRYLEQGGFRSRFVDVFREWTVANFLDGDGILGYDDLNISTSASGRISGFGQVISEIPQYAVEYTELRSHSEPFTLSFEGSNTVGLLPVDVGADGCWWSNSGDSIDSTLGHRVDLPADSTATLDYEVWFLIEEDWDYVYVEVSTNGGRTWRIIETPLTSSENPIGNGFGPGYTGASDGWVREWVDLTPYAGKEIWVRFQYVTDDSVNDSGACFRDLNIQTAKVGSDDQDWEADGFVFTNNLVRQEFQVQLIIIGDEPRVVQVPLDANNSAQITVAPPKDVQRLIVAVGTLAEKTRQPATYTLTVTPAK